MPPSAADLRTATDALVTAYQNIGAEHEALSAEQERTTARERLGTVRRMRQELADASLQLIHVVQLLATSHGMRELGLRGQLARAGDGNDYTPLSSVGDSQEKLCEAAQMLQVAIRSLANAYEPTQKYPALALARRPEAVRQVVRGLRSAVIALCTEFAVRGRGEDGTELAPCALFLEEFEARVCGGESAQIPRPSAAEVTAAIRADPEIARAAAATLEELTAV